MAECARDQQVAQTTATAALTPPNAPASGGVDVAALALRVRSPSVASGGTILVKGYHGWSGRGLLSPLSAVALAHRCLAGYRDEVPLASSAVQSWVEKMRAEL